MKVKVDITFNADGRITLHQRLVKMLGAEVGDGIEIMRYGCETLIRVIKHPDRDLYSGLLYATKNSKSKLQTRSVEITRHIIPEGEKCCTYRCGASVHINGLNFITIITRRNYYKYGN